MATIFTTIFLLILYPLISLFVADKQIVGLNLNLPVNIWFYMLLFEVFAMIAPQLCYYIGSRKVSASNAGIILLLEPVSASILSVLFLKEILSINIIIGGALILLSNYLVIKEES
jgi:drug/metabolite transporter (DMT)-like permease